MLASNGLSLLFVATMGFGADIPRPEHPRPDFERKEWANLNGTWDFRFDPADAGVKEEWFKQGTFDKKIVVPFAWESKLSGIQNLDKANKIGWYRREIEVPAAWQNKHVWLRFGAVDYEAKVWVNGKEVGGHVGGYTPFDIDITEHAKPGSKAVVVVRAFDPTDPFLPTGKQVGWYTTVSGIWQTVWLEARPKVYLADLKTTTRYEGDKWIVRFEAQLPPGVQNKEVAFHIHDVDVGSKVFMGQFAEGIAFESDVPNAKPWSPENPHLYRATITVKNPDGGKDEVNTYFGLRTVGRGKFGDLPHESILLNGKPVYLRGALDQSYNTDGLYTAPSEEFLVKELQFAKDVGLNFLRIHIKPEEPRRLYLADKMGVLIMQDVANAWAHNQRTREHWEACFRETYARSKNHPCIFSWCLFNETWGLTNGDFHNFKREPETQQWVAKMFDAAKKLDPTRLIEDISPCHYDHVKSDIHSWHFYIDNDAEATRHIADVVKRTFPGSAHNCAPGWKQGTEPLINSEYGSVSAGGGDRDVSWGFRHLTTQLRRHSKIQGYVYTELTDIEWEHNGFANYDRTKKDFGYDAWVPGMSVADLQGADFVGFAEDAGIVTKEPTLTLHPFVSHFDPNSKPAKIRWWFVGHPGAKPSSVGEADVRVKPFDVVEQPTVQIAFGDLKQFAGAVAVELLDEAGKRLACNYVNVVTPFDAKIPRVDASRPEGDLEGTTRILSVTFKPSEFSATSFERPNLKGGKFTGLGSGTVEYRIKVPPRAVGKAARIAMTFEAAARAGGAKVDWPSRPNSQDYPQSDERRHPSKLQATVDGKELKLQIFRNFAPGVTPPMPFVTLFDDPADARGVLSHMRHLDPGAYGYVVGATRDEPIVLKPTMTLTFAADAGLSIFDGFNGGWPVQPKVDINFVETIAFPADLDKWYGDSTTVDHYRKSLKPILSSGAAWKYTTQNPNSRSWHSDGFDDAKWQTGESGFGTSGTPAVKIKTRWATPDIWMRTTVDLPAGAKPVELRYFHDENVQVYVNGKQILNKRGYVTDYQEEPLSREQQAAFRPGKNVIAIHCRQTGGGQGVDFELLGTK